MAAYDSVSSLMPEYIMKLASTTRHRSCLRTKAEPTGSVLSPFPHHRISHASCLNNNESQTALRYDDDS